MNRNTPSHTDDTLTLRDLEARKEELEGERNDYEAQLVAVGDEPFNWTTDNEADADELKHLTAFVDNVSGYADRDETLINDAHFETYAQQLAEDGCDMKSADKWPFTCIDWERAARDLQSDYTSAEWDGVTFWFRS